MEPPLVSGWLCLPFVILLALIAFMPISPAPMKRWWERGYAGVALGLGLLVIIYYAWRQPGGWGDVAAALHEYFSFICLIGSLYIIAGGIHLRVKGAATPWENVRFLAIGALAANLIGTTGASIVLIRPWIRMNKVRIGARHIVFFIFLVSNIGGALTPIGDPPLFLGYLQGVPFFWLIRHVWPQWLFTVVAVLAVFYILDRRSFRRMPPELRAAAATPESWRFEGRPNLLFLAAAIAAVFLPDRDFMREATMVAAAAASWWLTPRQVHLENRFSFGPVKEVALLFAGIFMTMIPALGYLAAHGRSLGLLHPPQYYFAAGALSSVLDNAPTYLNFFQIALATFAPRARPPLLAGLLAAHGAYIAAVSLGSVFFGAMTYIGNGPNFMVKSIADEAGVRTPSFLTYIFKYSLPLLLPILMLGAWLWL